MATPLLIAQQIFSALSAANNNPNPSSDSLTGGCTTVNGTTFPSNNSASELPNLSTPVMTSAVFPTNVSSLFSLLLSFSALREWFKFLVLGSVLESLRRSAFWLYYKIYNSFFYTARFDDGDNAYCWIMVWLSKRPEWKRARDVQVSSRTYGVDNVESEADDPLKLKFIPSASTSFTFRAHGCWIRATRSYRENSYYGNREENLELCIFSMRSNILQKILKQAKEEYEKAQENTICIYTSDIHNQWRLLASRPKRPMNSIVLDPGIKNLLLEDARDFLESKGWYAARGIPFRRGYLLHGAPGSGKTSIIHSLAGELELDVYIISLSRSLLDDTALADLIGELPEKCIALMEDVDAAFDQNLNRGELDGKDSKSGSSEGSERGGSQEGKRQMGAQPISRVTLSGLLNALDGVGAQEGRILFATTNKYAALDPALTRPGRMDIHVQFKLASRYQARELYKCFYNPDLDKQEDEKEVEVKALEKGKEETEKAKTVDEQEVPKEEDGEVDVDAELDSGYSSADDKDKLLSSNTSDAGFVTSTITNLDTPDTPTFSGSSHRARAPKLSPSQVSKLASKFAMSIPEREFSMASLQGYLMTYKTRPYEAVKEVNGWIEKERKEKVEREERKKSKGEEAEKKVEENAKESGEVNKVKVTAT